MFNNTILDVFIGMTLLYLLYSLLISIIGEMISNWLGIRSRLLRKGMETMLNDPYEFARTNYKYFHDLAGFFLYEFSMFKNSFAGKFYENPSVKFLTSGRKKFRFSFRQGKPSYISKETFAETVMEMLRGKGIGKNDLEKIQFALKFNTLQIDPETLKHFRSLLSDANADIAGFRKKLFTWYDETNDRITGWYKRKLQFILFWLGFLVAVSFNVNSIEIARILAKDKVARDKMVELAVKVADSSSAVSKAYRSTMDSVKVDSLLNQSYDDVMDAVEESNKVIGLGWKYDDATAKAPWYKKLGFILCESVPWKPAFWGFVITALMLSLGSSFWFDLLKKLVAIRSTGVKPEEKKPESPEASATVAEAAPAVHPRSAREEPEAAIVPDSITGAILKNAGEIMKIPGVRSVVKGIDPHDKLRKFVQINVTDQDTADKVTLKYPALHYLEEKVICKVVVTGIPVNHLGANPTNPLPVSGDIRNVSGLNGYGSLGCVLRNTQSGNLHLLSCWHVMKGDTHYDSDDSSTGILGHDPRTTIGQRWGGGIQDTLDYGLAQCTDNAGLERNQWLKTALFSDSEKKLKARAVTSQDVENQIGVRFYDIFSGQKVTGKIYTDSMFVKMHYGDKLREIRDVLLITNDRFSGAVSRKGNSGSVVFDEDGHAIGMILGDDKFYTYALKLSHFFELFDQMNIDS